MSTAAASGSERLAALRRRIDAVDRRLVRLLAQRQRLVAALRPLKARLRDPQREAQVLRQAARQAHPLGLERRFVAEVFRALLAASRGFQRRRGWPPRGR